MNPASLSFSNVRCRRGDFVMEADTSFPAGKLTVILGPSGCGKTTLLDLAAGFIQPDMGEIREGERNVTSLPPEKRNIGVVFQDNALFPHMSVHRNIIFGPLSRGRSRQEAAETARQLTAMVRLEGYSARRPSSLSGGEKQRVALARALAIDPDILLLDEPFSALDAALRRQMRSEVKRIQRDTGITAVLVTHDQEEALALADHLAVMNDGRIVEEGAPEALWSRPQHLFTAGFLGRSTTLQISGIRSRNETETVLETAAGILRVNGFEELPPGDMLAVFRAEALRIDSRGSLKGTVLETEYAGGFWKVTVGIPNTEESMILEYRGGELPQPDQTIRLSADPESIRILPAGPAAVEPDEQNR